MINKDALVKALAAGEDSPETVRFKIHLGVIGGGKIFDIMPANLYNYLQALIYTQRIKADEDAERVLFQVNNVVDVVDVSHPIAKQLMKKIHDRNKLEIVQALKNINVLTA